MSEEVIADTLLSVQASISLLSTDLLTHTFIIVAIFEMSNQKFFHGQVPVQSVPMNNWEEFCQVDIPLGISPTS